MRIICTFKRLALLLLVLANFGCLPSAYRIDIPQGNLIDEGKLDEVEVGMEPRQVRYLLGTPLVTDTFNQDRWDYYYSIQSDNKAKATHHVTIVFVDGLVAEIRNNLQ